jgi:hypothetical protein
MPECDTNLRAFTEVHQDGLEKVSIIINANVEVGLQLTKEQALQLGRMLVDWAK